jgi:hypothetical protein
MGKVFIKKRNVRTNVARKPRVIRIWVGPKFISEENEGITRTKMFNHKPIKEIEAIKDSIAGMTLVVLGIREINGKKKQHESTTQDSDLNGSTLVRAMTNPVSSGMLAYQMARNWENIR